MALNYTFLEEVAAEGFWPPTDIYAFREMESNAERLARIADFETNVAAHQESVLTAAEWVELNKFEGGGLGCKIGCLAEYTSCMQGCNGMGCIICQTYLQQCFNGCNTQ